MIPNRMSRRRFTNSLAAMAGASLAGAGFSRPALAATPFKLGSKTVIALSDGTFAFPNEAWIGATDAEKAGLGNPVVIGANAYVLRAGKRVFLLDAGAGNGTFITSQFKTVGRVPAELTDAGLAREDITDIVITHMHPDHFGGTVFDGARTFPNAKIHVNATEWAFWTQDGFDTTAPEAMRPMVAAVQETARQVKEAVVLQEGEADLGDGVTMLPAFGHTAGHNVVLVDLGTEKLLLLGDTVVSDHIHFEHPEVGWMLDADPATAEVTRRKVLDMAASEGLIVAGNHVTAPGLGRVERAGGAFRFVAL